MDILDNELVRKMEEITWRGEYKGQQIVMTAHHIIWLEEEKPTPSPEKCKCSIHDKVYKGCTCKPKDEVEEKIIEIEKCIPSIYIFGVVEKKLRELVELARKHV